MKFSFPDTLEKIQLHHHKKGRSFCYINPRKLRLFSLSSLGLGFFFILFILYHPNHIRDRTQQDLNPTKILIRPNNNDAGGNQEYCDLFKGRWIPDLNASLYTNRSCRTMPDSKNCGKYGRMDVDFLQWRWKPDGCDLLRFDPKTFLRIVHGKRLAFVGDSVARNQMESLLCLLSLEETPADIYKDSEDRSRTWYFPSYDFTLMVIWSKFMVVGEERVFNGSPSGAFDLHLDRIDNEWASKLPWLDYAIISDAHWFFRKNYLYEGGKLIGCVFCYEANITDYGLGFAVRRVFRTALQYINNCKDCKDLLVLLRTFSPAHFENGTWNSGGNCNRTSPLKEEETRLEGTEWELRSVQLEEVERARKEGEKRKKIGALDVTRAMLMRPDGHPGDHWNNKGMEGYNDCVHWCLPGPIDAWNDLLLAVLSRENSGSFLY
ncbi:hypothetical protein NE237_020030 [Protea cynaroides]|uniref:Trichome birefringence-like N-terminal domain-containing protein n=1 Tax=Protea cynaroides TaxID=273540 RepID=A0A9Q0H6G0_9MAGN|nr:hypothetical protein NE237_020030 [Protea cynaroides]